MANIVAEIQCLCRDRMLNEALPVPRLYLYSGSDKLCEVHQLEPLIAKKQKQ